MVSKNGGFCLDLPFKIGCAGSKTAVHSRSGTLWCQSYSITRGWGMEHHSAHLSWHLGTASSWAAENTDEFQERPLPAPLHCEEVPQGLSS